MKNVTTIQEQGQTINSVRVPTRAEVDEVFGEFCALMTKVETAAGEQYRKADVLCRGLHWAVCARLNARLECDAIIDAGHYRLSEAMKNIRKANELLAMQWQYMRALTELERKNTVAEDQL